jgi:HSP20 family protein
MAAEIKETFISPRVNVIDNEDTVVIQAELPGVGKQGLELGINEGELTLTGRRTPAEQKGRYCINERRIGDYRRVFTLSRAIDVNTVQAELNDGLLTVTLAKVESVKPRKVTIK